MRLAVGRPRVGRGVMVALSLPLLLAVGAGVARAQGPIPVVLHPDPATGQTFYPIYRAYAALPVAGNAVFKGEKREKIDEAVPGMLDLADTATGVIDLVPFATFNKSAEENPEPETGANTNLTITIPASAKCPEVYPAGEFPQFGTAGIRTHWALLTFGQGATFTLKVRVKTTSKSTGQPLEHIDQWTWKLVANVESLHALIDALARHAVDVTGVSIIINRSVADQLHASANVIAGHLAANNIPAAKSAIQAMDQQVQDLTAAGRIIDSDVAPGYHGKCYLRTELEAIEASLPPTP